MEKWRLLEVEQVKVGGAHLVLQACAQDQVVVAHSPASRHMHALGLPVDAHHLPSHHGDSGVQGQLGQVSADVCMAADSKSFLLHSFLSRESWRIRMFFTSSVI